MFGPRQKEIDDGERVRCQSLESIYFSIIPSASGLTPLIAGRQNKLEERALSVQTKMHKAGLRRYIDTITPTTAIGPLQSCVLRCRCCTMSQTSVSFILKNANDCTMRMYTVLLHNMYEVIKNTVYIYHSLQYVNIDICL
jgi:hypothetical protein